MGFNAFQQKAIDASSKEDVLVSAGAGSGKTNTLSERVFTLVDKGEVAPESLLVLTFTNNAAHEMKTRILSRFPSDHPFAQRMLSCHVQSFDSFNAYLVRRYASALGVAPNIQILSSSIYDQRKRQFLDEEFEEVCVDETLRPVLVRLMREFGLKGDALIKSTALDLIATSEKLIPTQRASFFEKAKEEFLGEAFASDLYQRCIDEYKKRLRNILRQAYLIDQCRTYLVREIGEEIDVANLAKVLRNPAYYQVDLDQVFLSADSSQDHDFLDEEYQALVRLLKEEGEEFVSACGEFLAEHGEEYFQNAYPGKKRKHLAEANYHEPVFKALKKSREVLRDAQTLQTRKAQWEKMTRYGYAVEFFVALAQRPLARLQDYEKTHNAYTFQDVTALALTLFTDPKHESIAAGLRKRFTYVMVDEYQDTNVAQETFIEGLLRPNEDGSRAHLFCVGDAKQSIYAFRGSNVALFRRRQKEYESGKKKDAKVIPMAVNYRSAKRLLSQINYIFARYMRLDHGGIDYTDPIETLGYDDDVNLYDKELPVYGVHRIVPPQSAFLTGEVEKLLPYDPVSYEAKAILADIKAKLESKFEVFDRKTKGPRPCRKNDFCILVRRKRSVAIYQRLFAENGIALNNRVNQDLRDASAIALIQSLLRLLCFALGEEIDDLAHAFASVARSYAFRYDDDALHQILSADNTYDEEAAKEKMIADPIMRSVYAFAEEYRDSSFPLIFLGLLERFGVVENLYRIGAVEDNLAKIESLYALALAQGGVGEGLAEFVALFRDLDKRRLPLDSESVFENSDAVDLMTVHASKGLERKIVYMPSSDNGLGRGGSPGSKLTSIIDAQYGMVFPDGGLPFENPDVDAPITMRTLPLRLRSLLGQDEEEQENVRLHYVALTRAENAVYLVGQNKGRNSVYILMEEMPHFVQIHPVLLQNPNISDSLRQEYDAYVERKKTKVSPSFTEGEERDAQTTLLHECLDVPIQKSDDVLIQEILMRSLKGYRDRFVPLQNDEDAVASIYAQVFHYDSLSGVPVKDFATLLSALSKRPGADFDEEEIEGDADAETGETSVEDGPADEDALHQRLERFAQGIVDLDWTLLLPGFHLAKEKVRDAAYHERILIDLLLLPLAQRFDRVDYAFRESYENEGYPDHVRVFAESSFKGSVRQDAPKAPELNADDTPLAFALEGGKRASKQAVDGELPSREALERGTRLHRYMQLLDFGNLDLSFIPKEERPIIEKALSTPLMKEALSAQRRYPEYDFYDPETMHTGAMDLLFVCDGVYHIVDYKTSSIDDPDYDEQLRAYARNVMRLFGVEKENVRLHLLSLRFGKTRDVALD